MKRPGYDHLLKLIIIGDSSVGKTCILLRFSEDNFPTSHMPTIGKLSYLVQFLTVFFHQELTSKSSLSMWTVRQLNCKFGTLQVRRDLGLSLKPIIKELWELFQCTIAQMSRLSITFETGLSKLKLMQLRMLQKYWLGTNVIEKMKKLLVLKWEKNSPMNMG